MFTIVNELAYKWSIKLTQRLGHELAPTLNVIEGYRVRYIKEVLTRRLARCTSAVEKRAVVNSIPKITAQLLALDFERVMNIGQQSPELLKAIAIAITATKQTGDVTEYGALLALLEVDDLELSDEDVNALTNLVDLSDATVAYRRPKNDVLHITLEIIRESLAHISHAIDKVLSTRLHIFRNAILGSIMDI